jgi:hypothetical protein
LGSPEPSVFDPRLIRLRACGSRRDGAIFHSSDDDRYERLNDVVCVCAGEVRASAGELPELVIDIAELVWEGIVE